MEFITQLTNASEAHILSNDLIKIDLSEQDKDIVININKYINQAIKKGASSIDIEPSIDSNIRNFYKDVLKYEVHNITSKTRCGIYSICTISW